MMSYVKAFIAGFVATLVFHQGVFAALHAAGLLPRPAFNLTPVPPFGVPAVISLAFWGGVWGMVVWWLIRNARRARYWLYAIVLGAIGPSLVALFIVLPLKGGAVAGGWDPRFIVGALILNGAWGFGLALLMRVMQRPKTVTA
jgi:hypothetical protein